MGIFDFLLLPNVAPSVSNILKIIYFYSKFTEHFEAKHYSTQR